MTRSDCRAAVMLAIQIAAAAVTIACAPAATDTAVKSVTHNADLTVCRQRGMAAPKGQQWDVYAKCADEADAKDKGSK